MHESPAAHAQTAKTAKTAKAAGRRPVLRGLGGSIPLTLCLALLFVGPPASALTVPPPQVPFVADPTGLLLRNDADGNRSLMLTVEDGDGGTFTKTAASTPPQVPDVREAGVFTHAWTRDGSPMVTLGTYVVSKSNAVVREPALILENATSPNDAITAAELLASGDGSPIASNLEPFLLEFLLPEYQQDFSSNPQPSAFATYHDYPTFYVWNVHRTTAAGEIWSGFYIKREGSLTGGGATPMTAEKIVDFGTAFRQDGVTLRVAGLYVQNDVTSDEPGGAEPGHARDTVTVGTTATESRFPLATLDATDARFGADPVAHPSGQTDTVALGLTLPDGTFVPLVGAQTTITYAANGDTTNGQPSYDVTRITALGAFNLGAFTPVAGFRYHGDQGDVLAAERALTAGGPGAEGAGNFEIDVGAFPSGAYVPLAGAVHRAQFPGMIHDHASLIAVGVYGPTGFEGPLAVSYDGTEPLLAWATTGLADSGGAEGWRIAIGAYMLGSFEALVGVDESPAAPLGQYGYQRDATIGVFLEDYRVFVPIATVAYDGTASVPAEATAFALGGTFGSNSGDWDARAGAWLVGAQFVPLADLQYRSSSNTHGAASGSSFILGAYAPDGTFTPLAGLVYWGDAPFQQSLANAASPTDDRNSNFAAGAFVQGAFVPLVTVHNDGHATTATVGPALPT
ncbi:MAG: hypothetical protein ACYDCK_01970 [Thermoplasmatota archaeon]